MRHSLAALTLALFCFGCAPAGTTAPAPAAQATAPAPGVAMSGLYQRLCLQSFPNSGKFDAALATLDATALPAREVSEYLHDDPGRGWRLHADGVEYVLTVETPPFHTCAVRRMTPAGLADDSAYTQAVRDYGAARGLAIRQLPKHVLALPDGAELTAFSSILAPKGAKTARETSLLILTDYKGRLDRAKFPQAGDGPGVEVRMAHQIVEPFRIEPIK